MKWYEKAKKIMKSKGITQAEIAEALDVERPTVGHYLTGRRNPKARQINHIAELLGLPLHDLLSPEEYQDLMPLYPAPKQDNNSPMQTLVESMPEDRQRVVEKLVQMTSHMTDEQLTALLRRCESLQSADKELELTIDSLWEIRKKLRA